ncbi:MAG: methyltransferase domain-containing protein [Alphaproteobacteria bacterium]|nr:methyltransferase domain-containing protein [Alphaproteobacteria bacterium]
MSDQITPNSHAALTGARPAWTSPSFQLLCSAARRMRYGSLKVILPNGAELDFVGEEETETQATLIVNDFAFARRTLLGGDIGFFEAYADGQWDTPHLADLLYIFPRNADYIASVFDGSPIAAIAEQARHSWARRNTRSGSRRNISAHYDLGNTFYEKWLDRSMTYSSAKFRAPADDLATAQLNKYRSLAELIDLRPDDRVLEIGSGWGGFAEYAAKHVGAKVTGLTISREQYEYASKRIFEQGLSDRVDFQLRDYRDADGEYDKVASIEMFEAVGREYWPTYFRKINERLKPGGVAGLQVITIADRLFDQYLRSIDFIQRYVFPGGVLPSPTALRDQVEKAGLAWRGATHFGDDYARTLAEWHDAFLSKWQEIQPLGFDERFKKLWRFYLAYCEAGFRAKTTDVIQVTVGRP